MTSKSNKACHVTMLLYLDGALFGWVWSQPSRESPSGSNKTETNTPCTQFSPQSSQLSSGSPSPASLGCQEQISLSTPSMSVWDSLCLWGQREYLGADENAQEGHMPLVSGAFPGNQLCGFSWPGPQHPKNVPSALMGSCTCQSGRQQMLKLLCLCP